MQNRFPKLVCPKCRKTLEQNGAGFSCSTCQRIYSHNPSGYVDFVLDPQLGLIESTSETYADEQRASGKRFYREFIKPWADRENAKNILDVGCGLGMCINLFCQDGYDAYGIDLPDLARHWRRETHDPSRFYIGDGSRLPFPDGYFDALTTLGTIEHIGTTVGHITLKENYREIRRTFARELLRVTKPGGRILVTCPNKTFPIDFFHVPTDPDVAPEKNRWRRYVYDKAHIVLHRTFGRHYLLSYREIKKFFGDSKRTVSIRAISNRNFFAYDRLSSVRILRWLRWLVRFYTEHLPGPLRKSFFNPFLVVEIHL